MLEIPFKKKGCKRGSAQCSFNWVVLNPLNKTLGIAQNHGINEIINTTNKSNSYKCTAGMCFKYSYI